MKELLRFTIGGIIPSKKNEHEIRRDRRDPSRAWIAPSENSQTWENSHALDLCDAFPEYRGLKGPLAIEYIFHPTNRHRFDLSNKIESINDMLVSSGIIEDDNIFVLSELHPYLGSMSTSGELEVEVILYKISLPIIQRLFFAIRSI